MSTAALVYRTEKGQAEIKHRSKELQPRARALLFLVDGHRTVGDVALQAERLGLASDALADLEMRGLIARKTPPAATAASVAKQQAGPLPKPDAGRVSEARQFMNETIVDTLGVRSFFFVLKLERSSTLEDLRSLFDQYERAIKKGNPELEAQAFITRARELLV